MQLLALLSALGLISRCTSSSHENFLQILGTSNYLVQKVALVSSGLEKSDPIIGLEKYIDAFKVFSEAQMPSEEELLAFARDSSGGNLETSPTVCHETYHQMYQLSLQQPTLYSWSIVRHFYARLVKLDVLDHEFSESVRDLVQATAVWKEVRVKILNCLLLFGSAENGTGIPAILGEWAKLDVESVASVMEYASTGSILLSALHGGLNLISLFESIPAEAFNFSVWDISIFHELEVLVETPLLSVPKMVDILIKNGPRYSSDEVWIFLQKYPREFELLAAIAQVDFGTEGCEVLAIHFANDFWEESKFVTSNYQSRQRRKMYNEIRARIDLHPSVFYNDRFSIYESYPKENLSSGWRLDRSSLGQLGQLEDAMIVSLKCPHLSILNRAANLIVRQQRRISFAMNPMEILRIIAGSGNTERVASVAVHLLHKSDFASLGLIAPRQPFSNYDLSEVLQSTMANWNELGFLATFGFAKFDHKLSERILRMAWLKINNHVKLKELTFENSLCSKLSDVRKFAKWIPFNKLMQMKNLSDNIRLSVSHHDCLNKLLCNVSECLKVAKRLPSEAARQFSRLKYHMKLRDRPHHDIKTVLRGLTDEDLEDILQDYFHDKEARQIIMRHFTNDHRTLMSLKVLCGVRKVSRHLLPHYHAVNATLHSASTPEVLLVRSLIPGFPLQRLRDYMMTGNDGSYFFTKEERKTGMDNMELYFGGAEHVPGSDFDIPKLTITGDAKSDSFDEYIDDNYDSPTDDSSPGSNSSSDDIATDDS